MIFEWQEFFFSFALLGYFARACDALPDSVEFLSVVVFWCGRSVAANRCSGPDVTICQALHDDLRMVFDLAILSDADGIV